MLGSHLKLTRNVVRHKLTEEGIILVINQIVKPDSASDKDLFYLIYFFYFTEHMSILCVIYL